MSLFALSMVFILICFFSLGNSFYLFLFLILGNVLSFAFLVTYHLQSPEYLHFYKNWYLWCKYLHYWWLFLNRCSIVSRRGWFSILIVTIQYILYLNFIQLIHYAVGSYVTCCRITATKKWPLVLIECNNQSHITCKM